MERVPKAQSATCWKNKEIQRQIDLEKTDNVQNENLWVFAENIYFKNNKIIENAF